MKSNSSESAVALTELLNDYMCRCFPERTRKAKKSDAPWFNSKTRAAVNKKMRKRKANQITTDRQIKTVNGKLPMQKRFF